mgnify:CR=1 FL=1
MNCAANLHNWTLYLLQHHNIKPKISKNLHTISNDNNIEQNESIIDKI